jgi:LPXTG-site transpeptidase (sortase) family protein
MLNLAMRLLRTPRLRRIACWAERALWALGLSLLGYWGYSQAAIRFEQARLEESLFGGKLATEAVAENDWFTAHLASTAADPATTTADLASTTASNASLLAPGTLIALIEIPRVHVRAMVVEGVDTKSLERAAGHLPGTALPGTPGNSVMAAHRDTLFAGLRHVRLGDLIILRTDEREFSYQVSGIDVVTPRSLHVLDPTSHPSLTLITCFPFDFVGPAPMRFVVSATEMSAAAAARPQILAGGGRVVEAKARGADKPKPRGASKLTPRGASKPTPRSVEKPTPRPLDHRVMSLVSASMVKPGAS